MKLHFDGTLGELKDWLILAGIYGSWNVRPNGVHMMRCSDGANLHWSETRGTLWFSGRPGPSGRLAGRVESLLVRMGFEPEPTAS